MSGNQSLWNYGLIFAALCVLLGIAGFASALRTEHRRLASGLFLQGVMLVFVVGAAYFQPNNALRAERAAAKTASERSRRVLTQGSTNLRLAGFAVVGLLIVQSLVHFDGFEVDPRMDEGQS